MQYIEERYFIIISSVRNRGGSLDIDEVQLLDNNGSVHWFQGSADSNYSQPSSELSLDEDKEALRREKEAQALSQLDKARVNTSHCYFNKNISRYKGLFDGRLV
jgi:hypothetical protein